MIVRELSSDIYFSQPSGFRTVDQGRWVGQREGYDTMRYNEGEVRRIVEYAFDLAGKRKKKICSVDKSNVLEASQVWRDVATEVASHHKNIEFSCMYADNSAMQLVRAPTQFDVIVTGNLFGDILSDLGSVVAGSIGMLPSASLADAHYGLYEPIHGSAPDLAGQNKANPLGTILSAAMMLDISFSQPALARRIENAVSAVLDKGLRTGDIYSPGTTMVGTREMGDAVIEALNHH
jgi:3-isopropylmalate dehydrogenase